MDWDGDGTADDRDEWIELHNAGPVAIDLGGWFLDDAAGGSEPYPIPAGTVLEPGGFAVFYRRETAIVLDDGGDEVRLLGPAGAVTVVDRVAFGALLPDTSTSRDAAGVWHADWPPSPGGPNWLAGPVGGPGQAAFPSGASPGWPRGVAPAYSP